MLVSENPQRRDDRGCRRLAHDRGAAPVGLARAGAETRTGSRSSPRAVVRESERRQCAAAAGLIDMSAVALHKWMRKMGAFLAAVLAVMTDAAKSFAAEAWAGYEILIIDASSVTR